MTLLLCFGTVANVIAKNQKVGIKCVGGAAFKVFDRDEALLKSIWQEAGFYEVESEGYTFYIPIAICFLRFEKKVNN